MQFWSKVPYKYNSQRNRYKEWFQGTCFFRDKKFAKILWASKTIENSYQYIFFVVRIIEAYIQSFESGPLEAFLNKLCSKYGFSV